MDINYELGDYKFVWDSEKAIINKKKHKLSFETAARVFLDENAYFDYAELKALDGREIDYSDIPKITEEE